MAPGLGCHWLSSPPLSFLICAMEEGKAEYNSTTEALWLQPAYAALWFNSSKILKIPE